MDNAPSKLHRRHFKGPRRFLATRVPLEDAARASAAAAAAGLTVSDYIADLLAQALAEEERRVTA